MNRVLALFHHAVFAIFIICNAIICSVAVWNLSIARALGWNFQIDVFLIFVGASGLALIFTIIFVDLLRTNAVTSRVWFECVWVGLFWIMDLAGAAALTATVPSLMCEPAARTALNDSCSSTQVLLAFTWICTITLLGYFSLLVISVILRYREGRDIWKSNVHDFLSSDKGGRLSSGPPSPNLPRFRSSMVVAPTTLLAIPVPAANYPQRAGPSTEYYVEHSRPPIQPKNLPLPSLPATVPPRRYPESTRQVSHAGTSLYPQYIQSALPARILPPVPPRTQQPVLPPSPPLLGDWPRADAISQPLRVKRKNFTEPMAVTPTTAEDSVGTSPPNSSSSRSNPFGPRTRSSSRDNRPPPLDLSKSTYKSRR